MPMKRENYSPPDMCVPLGAVSAALIARRTSLRRTQREVATLCGIKQSYYARLEKGKSDPLVTTLWRIAARGLDASVYIAEAGIGLVPAEWGNDYVQQEGKLIRVQHGAAPEDGQMETEQVPA